MKYLQTFDGFLGLNEAGDQESGMAGLINSAIGPKEARVVISSANSVEKWVDRIQAALARVDREARMEFFPKTGKMVGVMAMARLKDLQRELKRIDAGLTAEIKGQRLA
jgi:hypothetical protein